VSVERQTKKDKDRQAEDSEGHKEHGGGRVKGMKKNGESIMDGQRQNNKCLLPWHP